MAVIDVTHEKNTASTSTALRSQDVDEQYLDQSLISFRPQVVYVVR